MFLIQEEIKTLYELAAKDNFEYYEKIKEIEAFVIEKDRELDNLKSLNKCLKDELKVRFCKKNITLIFTFKNFQAL